MYSSINSNIGLSTEVIVGIQQNLTVGFINILYLIYKDTVFVKVSSIIFFYAFHFRMYNYFKKSFQ